MSDDFLSRWSRRKIEARKGEKREENTVVTPVQTGAQPTPADAPITKPELPPVESLTPESDFTPFMRAEVDPDVKREALKTLFRDPRHNVMDGLDVYIDDYSKPDPLPEGWLEKLNAVAHLGDQPGMRRRAEEEAQKQAELEQKSATEQVVVAENHSHPDGASQPPSPSPESKDSSPEQPG